MMPGAPRRPGRGTHCFEYDAVLFDVAEDRRLVEGVDPMELEHGLICSLRSCEDAPRRLSTRGKAE
jgi:hypothetical protein